MQTAALRTNAGLIKEASLINTKGYGKEQSKIMTMKSLKTQQRNVDLIQKVIYNYCRILKKGMILPK